MDVRWLGVATLRLEKGNLESTLSTYMYTYVGIMNTNEQHSYAMVHKIESDGKPR
jgi:hypothetical protein